jgi:hypothetical protein
MAQPRCLHVATLLPSGDVLVAGGVESDFGLQRTVATAELYNPSTGVWQTTGSLNVARVTAAALLQSGQVLVAGGYNTSNSTTTYLAGAELYDPSTGHWSSTASMKAPDSSPTTPVLLTNGDVLVSNEGQFYNPAMAGWTSTGALPNAAGPPSVATPSTPETYWPAERGVPIVDAGTRPLTAASCTLPPATRGFKPAV